MFIATGLQFSARGQSQYYYKVGDTIRGRDTIYFYQWWSEQWLSDTSNLLYYQIAYNNSYGSVFPYAVDWIPNGFCGGKTLGRYTRYNYTAEPLNIVGLAACIVFTYEDTDVYPQPPDTAEPTYPEYLLLYDAQTDAFPLLAAVQYHHAEPVRYMEVPLRGRNPYYGGDFGMGQICCLERHDVNRYLPVHEYYFDKPVTVYDSFYVGMTSNNFS